MAPLTNADRAKWAALVSMPGIKGVGQAAPMLGAPAPVQAIPPDPMMAALQKRFGGGT